MELTNLTASKLAALFGVSRRTIFNWVDLGLPQNENKRFDFKACAKWKFNQLQNEIEEAREDSEPTLLKLKIESQKIQNLRVLNDLKKMLSNLVPRDLALESWDKMITIIQDELRKAASELKSDLEHVTNEDRKNKIIADFNLNVLDKIALRDPLKELKK